MTESSIAQKQCGIWLGPNFAETETRAQVANLVSSGVLTQAQGRRVIAHDVRVGDPECMAYAAYGASLAKESFAMDSHKNLVTVEWDFTCQHSPVSCPGLVVVIADGKVSAVYPKRAANRNSQ